MKKNLAGAIAFLLVSGCASMAGKSKFSSAPLFDKPLQDIDIIAILTDGKESGSKLQGDEFAAGFDTALRNYKGGQQDINRVQDRIVMASNILCEEYKTVLKEKQSRVNFYAGSAAIISGAAGAVVGGARAAKNLAALSGISSGIKAEYDEDYYSSITAQLIAAGIDSRRKDILDKIDTIRGEKDQKYTLESAIADAVVYHGACSLVGGLEQADAALKTLDHLNLNAGLDALSANAAFKQIQHPQQPSTSTVKASGADGASKATTDKQNGKE